MYIKRNVEKVWGARYRLGARHLSKNTVIRFENEEQNTAKNSSSKMARLQKFEYSKAKFPYTVRSDTV
jgi:hypothetical protein